MLVALSLGAGLLSAVAALPVIGVAGIAVKNASQTFNNLPVAGLGQVPSRTEILNKSGKVLAIYYPRGIYRDPVSWHQIAPVMRDAIVAIEDYRFWSHGAFDLHGTLRAVYSDLSGNQVQGGSDLAQQYVKNACILTAKTKAAAQACTAFSPARKITELRIAANVEREMTKPELLTAYLNVAYFDNQAYGIKVASQVYFSVPPGKLTLTQAALLAGIVESPTRYDPFANPQNALDRRGQVLHAMAEHGYISWATERKAVKAPLGLHRSYVPLQTGCSGAKIKNAAFFCDYVMSQILNNPAYQKAKQQMLTVGGLKIHTTLSAKDQRAATNAVNYVVPPKKPYYNPGYNVDTEVMVQPGTGYVKAIAVDRPYGFGPGQTSVDYAVDTKYDGGAGVQTGSSSKLFTLITALKQGLQFGFNLKVHDNMTVGGFSDCHGNFVNPFTVSNADGNEGGKIPLYFGTTASINAFYVALESKVGLCNVVKTAVSMGLHRADGTSLLKTIGSMASELRACRRWPGLVHARLGQCVADVDGRGVCERRGPRRLLPPDRDHEHHRRARQQPACAVGWLPPSHDQGRRGRGQLRTSRRAGERNRSRPEHPRPGGCRKDRYCQRRLLRRLRRLYADPGWLRVGLQPAQPDRFRGHAWLSRQLQGVPWRLSEGARPDVRR